MKTTVPIDTEKPIRDALKRVDQLRGELADTELKEGELRKELTGLTAFKKVRDFDAVANGVASVQGRLDILPHLRQRLREELAELDRASTELVFAFGNQVGAVLDRLADETFESLRAAMSPFYEESSLDGAISELWSGSKWGRRVSALNRMRHRGGILTVDGVSNLALLEALRSECAAWDAERPAIAPELTEKVGAE